MKPSLLIGHLKGTEIRLHWTLLLLFPYVYLAFQPRDWLEGARALLFIGLIFLCVLMHELGHLVMARLYGQRVSGVVLWILGGAAITEREPDDPTAQLFIAGAGPLVNLLISALLLILLAGLGVTSIVFPGIATGLPVILPLRSILFLILTNLILAGSNLLPIYPLDGGRIFKAFLQMIVGPARSTVFTFWLSAILAAVLMVWAALGRSWLIAATALILLLGAITLNQNFVLGVVRLYARLARRADLYIRLGDFDPAIELLTRRIDQDPQDPELYLQRAYASYFMDDLGHALADTERVLGLMPDSLAAILLRGALFYALGQSENAWTCVDLAESIRPGWVMTALNRAILLRDEGRLEEALVEANHAAAEAEKEPVLRGPVLVLLVRSTVSFSMGDLEGARKDWDAALHANAREASGFSPDRVRIFARDWAWVEAYFQYLQEHAPDRSALPVSLGEIAMRAGQSRRAAEEYSEAIRRFPTQPDLSYYRGLVYLQLGENDQAARDFRTAHEASSRAHIRRLAAARLRLINDGAGF